MTTDRPWPPESRTFTNPDGHTWTEYKLDPHIALRIKELKLGLGCNVHSWRAIAMCVVGYECQMTGKDLERLAAWTLDEDVDDWDAAVAERMVLSREDSTDV